MTSMLQDIYRTVRDGGDQGQELSVDVTTLTNLENEEKLENLESMLKSSRTRNELVYFFVFNYLYSSG
jgi:hypothetical protein